MNRDQFMRRRMAKKRALTAENMWELADDLRRRKRNVEIVLAEIAEALALLLEREKPCRRK